MAGVAPEQQSLEMLIKESLTAAESKIKNMQDRLKPNSTQYQTLPASIGKKKRKSSKRNSRSSSGRRRSLDTSSPAVVAGGAGPTANAGIPTTPPQQGKGNHLNPVLEADDPLFGENGVAEDKLKVQGMENLLLIQVLRDKIKEISQLREHVRQLEQDGERRQNEIRVLKQDLSESRKRQAEKDKRSSDQINAVTERLNQAHSRATKMSTQVQDKTRELGREREANVVRLANMKKSVEQASKRVAELEEELRMQISRSQGEIEQLNNALADLQKGSSGVQPSATAEAQAAARRTRRTARPAQRSAAIVDTSRRGGQEELAAAGSEFIAEPGSKEEEKEAPAAVVQAKADDHLHEKDNNNEAPAEKLQHQRQGSASDIGPDGQPLDTSTSAQLSRLLSLLERTLAVPDEFPSTGVRVQCLESIYVLLRSDASCLERASESDAVDSLILAMRSEDEKTCEGGTRCLRHILQERANESTKAPTAQASASRLAIPPEISQALPRVLTSASDVVLKEGLALLRLLCLRPELEQALASAEVLRPVVNALSASDVAVVREAVKSCRALGLTAANKTRLRRLGALEPLVALLKGSDVECGRHAARTLSVMCISPDNRIEMRSIGAIGSVVEAVGSSDVETQRSAVGCLINLSVNGKNKVDIRKAGGVPILAKALESDDPEVRRYSVRTLCNMAINLANRTEMWALGVVTTLRRHVAAAPRDDVLKRYSVRCLTSLVTPIVLGSGPLPDLHTLLSTVLENKANPASEQPGVDAQMISEVASVWRHAEPGGAGAAGDSDVASTVALRSDLARSLAGLLLTSLSVDAIPAAALRPQLHMLQPLPGVSEAVARAAMSGITHIGFTVLRTLRSTVVRLSKLVLPNAPLPPKGVSLTALESAILLDLGLLLTQRATRSFLLGVQLEGSDIVSSLLSVAHCFSAILVARNAHSDSLYAGIKEVIQVLLVVSQNTESAAALVAQETTAKLMRGLLDSLAALVLSSESDAPPLLVGVFSACVDIAHASCLAGDPVASRLAAAGSQEVAQSVLLHPSPPAPLVLGAVKLLAGLSQARAQVQIFANRPELATAVVHLLGAPTPPVAMFAAQALSAYAETQTVLAAVRSSDQTVMEAISRGTENHDPGLKKAMRVLYDILKEDEGISRLLP